MKWNDREEKAPYSFCHSERSEESLFLFMAVESKGDSSLRSE